MKKIPLADVLWEAANKLLSSKSVDDSKSDTAEFSCHAVYMAALGVNWRTKEQDPIDEFLRLIGCDPLSAGFDEIAPGHARQGVRYMWLLLAMHVAEDEGIMVEVQS